MKVIFKNTSMEFQTSNVVALTKASSITPVYPAANGALQFFANHTNTVYLYDVSQYRGKTLQIYSTFPTAPKAYAVFATGSIPADTVATDSNITALNTTLGTKTALITDDTTNEWQLNTAVVPNDANVLIVYVGAAAETMDNAYVKVQL